MGHSRTCSPECARFIQDPDKIQPSFQSGESNSGFWEEVTPICQASRQVVLGGPERGKEDAEALKQEEKCQKKSTGPVLSLDGHEDSVTDLMKWATPSWVSQPPSKASSSGSRDRGKVQLKHPPPNQLDDELLSNRADEPKAKNRKRDPTPDLVVLEDDNSTPLVRKVKGMGKKARTHNPGKD